jgi:NADH-quinone oxidoreductase subunit I
MASTWSHLGAIISGTKHLLRRRMTLRYPDMKLELPDGYRYDPKLGAGIAGYKGRHVLDMEKCNGCSLCAIICKNITGAITMVTVQGAFARNKKGLFPQFDFGLCVFCGFCVDACNFDALAMSTEYELSSFEKSMLVYHPRELTAPVEIGNVTFHVSGKDAHHDRKS